MFPGFTVSMTINKFRVVSVSIDLDFERPDWDEIINIMRKTDFESVFIEK